MKKIFPLFAVIIVLVLAVCSFHIIPTGYTGVKTSFGQIQETTIQSGKLNFCIPFVQSIDGICTFCAKALFLELCVYYKTLAGKLHPRTC